MNMFKKVAKINYVWNVCEVDGLKIKLQIWDTAGQ